MEETRAGIRYRSGRMASRGRESAQKSTKATEGEGRRKVRVQWKKGGDDECSRQKREDELKSFVSMLAEAEREKEGQIGESGKRKRLRRRDASPKDDLNSPGKWFFIL